MTRSSPVLSGAAVVLSGAAEAMVATRTVRSADVMHAHLAHALTTQGIVSRRTSGVSNAVVGHAVRSGQLLSLFPGTYAEQSTHGTLTAALLDWDPDAVLTAGSAAHLSWWPQHRPAKLSAITRRRLCRPVAGVALRQASLEPDLVIESNRLRVTHPALTALDLAREMGPAALDEAFRRRAVSVSALEWALAQTRHRPGNQTLARWVADSRDEPWSVLERDAHRLLRANGITGWRSNYHVNVPWGFAYLDIAFPGARLALEVDGWEYHSDYDSFVEDRRRDVELQIAGWSVLRFTAVTLSDLPDAVRRWFAMRGGRRSRAR